MGVNRVAPIITGQSTAQTIKGSLKFQSALSTYLNRTFSLGNTKIATWSGWIKRSGLGTNDIMFSQIGSEATFRFNTSDEIELFQFNGGSYKFRLNPTRKFRDTSAWYHMHFMFDTTRSIESDRFKLFINGELVRDFNNLVYPTLDFSTFFNTAQFHRMGSAANLYMSNAYWIDGQALGPRFFGFTDPLTGTWRPKRLREGDTSLNDGTTWSNDLSATDASFPAVNGFDGDLTTSVRSQGAGSTLTWTPTKGLSYTSSVRVYMSNTNYLGETLNLSLNGGTNVPVPTVGWYTLATGSGTIRTISSSYTATYQGVFSAIEVDGEILTDSAVSAAFGTNGFYLPLDDQDDYTTDKSGKGNNYTASGFTGTSSNPDVVPDSPSGVVGSTKPTSGITTTSSITKPTNYATWNPLTVRTGAGTLQYWNGNLSFGDNGTASTYGSTLATMSFDSGKWYFEITLAAGTGVDGNVYYGILPIEEWAAVTNVNIFNTCPSALCMKGGDTAFRGDNTSDNTYGTGANIGDTFGFAVNVDSLSMEVYRNGVSFGTFPYALASGKTWTPFVTDWSNGQPVSDYAINFGQRPFKHQPPAGYLTLCSANLRPSTVVTRPDQYVGIVTYTGTGSTRNVGGLNFSPDLVIIKDRSTTNNVLWSDTVRRPGRRLISNLSIADATDTDRLSAFTSDGFTVGNAPDTNDNSSSNYYVGWAWKAGGGARTLGVATSFYIDDVDYGSAAAAGLSGGDLTITGASVGTKQGFSIIQYQGNNLTGQTIKHGLTQKPDFILVKNKDEAYEWMIYHKSMGATYYGLFAGSAFLNDANIWADTEPTDEFFYVSVHNSPAGYSNGPNGEFISYLWHDVPGLQKFGSYQGNGDVGGDGPFIELSFEPALVIVKAADTISTEPWCMVDNERKKYNPNDNVLFSNLANAESTGSGRSLDLLSNGFKVRTNNAWYNQSSVKYIYAAWAEAPSFNLYGGQSLAR